ncbi:MAG TPA: DUF166 family protein [Methanoregulaceae archaeon]|nr:DUF166 family protein [Methanoregulaceae archaeon]HQJ88379.1 DUF166 family protein [Methanoregulaceae archaeon]
MIETERDQAIQETIRVCIVSDGAFGDRAFEQCMARFPTEFVLVEPLAPNVVDDVAIEVPEADLYLSYLRSPAQALALVEKGRPVILGVSFGPGFTRQARCINPDVIAPETMCSLEPTTGSDAIDAFARAFGRPRFAATVRDGRLVRLEVLHGSPCGSTVAAAAELVGQYLSPAMLRHFGLRICHHCRAPRLGRTCDKETAGLIHVRELLRALPPEAVDAGLIALGAECDQLYTMRKGRLDGGTVQPGELNTGMENQHD